MVLHYPNRGGRDAFKLPLTGALLSLGWSDEEIANFILAVAQAAGDEEARERINGDRKSTRLNSSHANISYAVFCLKKNDRHRKTRRHEQRSSKGSAVPQ